MTAGLHCHCAVFLHRDKQASIGIAAAVIGTSPEHRVNNLHSGNTRRVQQAGSIRYGLNPGGGSEVWQGGLGPKDSVLTLRGDDRSRVRVKQGAQIKCHWIHLGPSTAVSDQGLSGRRKKTVLPHASASRTPSRQIVTAQ
jgi:hypothetical protein